jgi:hypothetical protein
MFRSILITQKCLCVRTPRETNKIEPKRVGKKNRISTRDLQVTFE